MRSMTGNIGFDGEKGRTMRKRGLAAGAGWLAVVLLCWPGMSAAATYQLQVASVPERVFTYFAEDRTLPGIEAFLDDKQRSKRVMFGDRQPQPLELMTAGQSQPSPVDMTLAKRHDPWGTTTWSGEAGQLAVFRINGRQSNYQRLKWVAVQTDGVLTRLPVRGIPPSRPWRMQAPATAASYLAHALESGTFAAWTEKRAASYDGLSVVVGRHQGQSDTVYLSVRMPRAGQAYKVILGWENSDGGAGGRV